MAWLNATPEGSKRSRHKSFMDLDENSSFLKLPNLEGADYIISMLYEAGLFSSNGMGAVSLPWVEIDAWLHRTGLELSTWEILTIKELSDAYVAELNQASAKDRPAPYIEVVEDEAQIVAQRSLVMSKLKSVFGSMKRKTQTEIE